MNSTRVLSNRLLDMAFVERGKQYNHIVQTTKQLHQLAIDAESTDVLNVNDWVLMQFLMMHLAIEEGQLIMKEELK